jgi:DNA-binding transcriptional LysR family regulator
MDQEVDLRHLRYFLQVSESLHFGRAAEILGISQPPLSQQIKRLEHILGYPLFERTTRGVKLTRVGQYFSERARKIVGMLQDDIDRVRRLAGGETGVLTIGVSTCSVMLSKLPKAIKRYRSLYPDVEFRIREVSMVDQFRSLRNGELDLGFMRDGKPCDGLSLVTIERRPFIAILPTGHSLAARKTLRPSDLRNEQFVLFPRELGSGTYDRITACCSADGFWPKVGMEVPQWPNIIQLIASGLGVCLAPACVGEFSMAGVEYKKLRSSSWSSLDVGMKPKLDNPVAEAFLEIVLQEFSISRGTG